MKEPLSGQMYPNLGHKIITESDRDRLNVLLGDPDLVSDLLDEFVVVPIPAPQFTKMKGTTKEMVTAPHRQVIIGGTDAIEDYEAYMEKYLDTLRSSVQKLSENAELLLWAEFVNSDVVTRRNEIAKALYGQEYTQIKNSNIRRTITDMVFYEKQ